MCRPKIRYITYFFVLFVLGSFTNVLLLYASCLPYPTVVKGTLIKDCKIYKAIGVNYFDAFYRVLKNSDDKSYVEGLKKLSQRKIPFARVMASGFWVKDWKLYFEDERKYFELLDEVIKTAEIYNIGLVLTLFWNVPTIPDLMGEPISAWGNPESKTISFMKKYTKEVVLRYKNVPVVWGYEFGNEYNLISDLPQGYQKVAPQHGTPAERTESDKLRLKDFLVALREFADTVRRYDDKKLISTGNSFPRPVQYHLAYYKMWRKDTFFQFLEILNQINPHPFLISLHIYPSHSMKFFSEFTVDNFKDLLYYAKLGAVQTEKTLFIGEFGVCRKEKHLKEFREEKEIFESLIRAIEENNIPLSALWVYDLKKQEDPCNVTFENDRSYQLERIIKANTQFKNKGDISNHE